MRASPPDSERGSGLDQTRVCSTPPASSEARLSCGSGGARRAVRRSDGYLGALPAVMQETQTRMRLCAPDGSRARIRFKLGFHRRFVALRACDRLFPNIGPLPHISHTLAITKTPK